MCVNKHGGCVGWSHEVCFNFQVLIQYIVLMSSNTLSNSSLPGQPLRIEEEGSSIAHTRVVRFNPQHFWEPHAVYRQFTYLVLTHTMNLIIIKSLLYNQYMRNLPLLCVKRLARQTTLHLGHFTKQ